MITISVTLIICSLVGFLNYLEYKNSCKHKYQVLEQINIQESDYLIGRKIISRCEICGKLVSKTFIN